MYSKYRLVLSAAVAMCVPHFAVALSQDYYVHFGTFNGSGYVDTYVTPGSPNGTPYVKPAGACGFRFEHFDETDWIFGGGFDFTPDFNVFDHDYIDVYLPSGGCGAWQNLVVEPHDHPLGEPSLVSPPGDFAGMLYIPDGKAYWIDKNGNKLIYKHVCPDCSGGDVTYGSQGSVHGWIVVPEQLKALTQVLSGLPDIRSAAMLFDLSQRSLGDLSRELSVRVTRRRIYNAGNLEGSLRAIEDDAMKNLNSAIARQSECRAFKERGDLKSAVNACQAAADAVRWVRGEIATAENWVVR